MNKKEIKDLKKKRDSSIVWMPDRWIYREVQPYVNQANKKAGWNFNWDWSESCQFTKYKPGEGYFKNHYERDAVRNSTRELAYMVYLNTLTDKGGTIFPQQKKTLTPIKGKMVVWPAHFTHPHRGLISSTQEKYIATGWFEII